MKTTTATVEKKLASDTKTTVERKPATDEKKTVRNAKTDEKSVSARKTEESNRKAATDEKKTAARTAKSEGREEPSRKPTIAEGPSEQADFHEFFVEQLKDIYWAEKHLKKGLRKMSRAATSPKLAAAFEKHYNEGDKQLEELETVFGLLGEKPAAKRCEAMAGLLEEADGMIEDTDANSLVRDAGLILAAQKVEHYEIATYGTLKALAAYLPDSKVQRMLGSILTGEKKTDCLLTALAEDYVNECAAQE